MPRAPLTPKQARFVEYYLVSLNATDAYREAYGRAGKVAEAGGARLVGNAKVAAAIATAKAARSERVEITADRVLRELAILAFSDVRHFSVDHIGNLELTAGAPDEAWRAVSSVKHKIRTFGAGDERETVREIEFRLWDKNSALEKVAKHIRFYPPEKVEHTGDGGGPIAIAGVDLDALNDAQLAALAAQLARP